ncbi:MAG: yfiT 3 [Planctomycetaceae bacterium]|nr:yfiT 3 [Planctomycetaceae bacterium]
MTSTPLAGTTQSGDQSPTPDELITAYERGIDDLVAAVAGMTADQLLARPIAGKWSTLEVVCHIADCEQFFADRIKRTIALQRPLLMGVDSDLYLESLNYQQRDVQEELDLVAATRHQLARILPLLPVESWQRTGVHSEKGLMTLHQLLLYPTNHLHHHLKFVAEKRAAMK